MKDNKYKIFLMYIFKVIIIMAIRNFAQICLDNFWTILQDAFVDDP